MKIKPVLLLYFLNKNKSLFFLKYFVCIPSGKKFVADLVVVGVSWFCCCRCVVLFCFLRGLCCLVFYYNNFILIKIFFSHFALPAE